MKDQSTDQNKTLDNSVPVNLDLNVLTVIQELLERSQQGIEEYGVSTFDAQEDLSYWLQHLKEELLDGAIYIQKVLQILDEKAK